MFLFGVTGDKPEDFFIRFVDIEEPRLLIGGGIDSLQTLGLIQPVGFDTGLLDKGLHKGETAT